MKIIPVQYARALYEAARGQNEAEIKVAAKRLVEMLTRHQALKKLPAIIAAFEDLWEREENEWRAELSSVNRFTDTEKEALSAYWSRHTGRAGARLEFVEKQDPGLLGGFRLQAGGRLLDASLQTAIADLKLRLNA